MWGTYFQDGHGTLAFPRTAPVRIYESRPHEVTFAVSPLLFAEGYASSFLRAVRGAVAGTVDEFKPIARHLLIELWTPEPRFAAEMLRRQPWSLRWKTTVGKTTHSIRQDQTFATYDLGCLAPPTLFWFLPREPLPEADAFGKLLLRVSRRLLVSDQCGGELLLQPDQGDRLFRYRCSLCNAKLGYAEERWRCPVVQGGFQRA